MEEIWRKIPGFEGYYEISSERRVKSVDREVVRSDGQIRHYKGVLLKASVTPAGYQIISLRKNGKLKQYLLHNLFAKTFPELIQNEWFPGAEIDHINTIRTDNRPENLRWVDRSGNMSNPITKKHNSDSKIGREAPNKKWVIKLSLNNEILHFYPSIRLASKDNNIPESNISKCCSGKRNQAGGYIWKYAC